MSHLTPYVAVLAAGLVIGCTVGGVGGDAGSNPDGSSTVDSASAVDGVAVVDAAPAFTCVQAAAESPELDAVLTFDPAEPHPGDTLNVLVRATNGTGRSEAPAMTLDVVAGAGLASYQPQAIEGGAAIYYYAIPDLPAGEVCVLGTIGGVAEISAKVMVTQRPPITATGAAFKVISNHQWSCAEQPECGNYIEIRVVDEEGVGIADAVVNVAQADTTVPPIYNDTEPTSIPTSVTTDGSGVFTSQNWWPTNENGLQILKFSVAGAPSDIATEITTGWWEDDLLGCNYCSTHCVNVWGHWSYTLVFQRTAGATMLCEVENDHGGMTTCGEPRHIHHHPDHRACWPIE